MGKSSVKYEVLILLAWGIEPSILIDMGYSRSSVYGMNRRMKMARESLNKLLSLYTNKVSKKAEKTKDVLSIKNKQSA